MKRALIQAVFVYCFVPVVLCAQSTGNGSGTGGGNWGGGNIGGGNIGSGGSNIGSGSSGSSSSGSTSGGGNTGNSYEQTSLDAAVDTPKFQGWQELGSGSFVGRPTSGSPFIGRDQSFDGSRTPSNRRVSSSSSTRRTTSSRTSTSRTSMGRATSNSGENSVRAMTQMDFSFSPMEVGYRETSFRTRMNRLPSLRVVPEQIQVRIGDTKDGTVATLRGTVASERDRKLVRQLLLLEPGIDKVDNQLVVDAGMKTDSLPKLDPGAENTVPTQPRTTPLLAPVPE